MAMLLTRIQRITSRHAEFSSERIRKVSRSSGAPCSVLRCRCVSPALAETRELLVRPLSAGAALHAWTGAEMAGKAPRPAQPLPPPIDNQPPHGKLRREDSDVQQLRRIRRLPAARFDPGRSAKKQSGHLPPAGPRGLTAAAGLLLAAKQGDRPDRMPLAARIRWRDRCRLMSTQNPGHR